MVVIENVLKDHCNKALHYFLKMYFKGRVYLGHQDHDTYDPLKLKLMLCSTKTFHRQCHIKPISVMSQFCHCCTQAPT